NNTITIDSTNIVTPAFNGYGLTASDKNWITVKDVTPYIQNSNNQLITPCQSCSLYNNIPNWDYVYSGFLLVVIYENNTMPTTNVVLFVNSQNLGQNMTFNLSGLNSIDNTKDAGLSIWTDNLNIEYPINFILNSTVGNFNLGSLWFNEAYATLPKSELLVPGSFYYQNNTLFGLRDDSPNAFIDSTDALANIKTYVGNGTTSFSLSATLNPQGYDYINAFVLAYSSLCPERSITPTQNYSLCVGNNKQLTINSSNVNSTYNWYATDSSLSSYTIANPIASPTVSTNYIAYVDSAGCKHTEHFSIAVYANQKFDSLSVSNVICGNPSNSGAVNVVGTKGGTTPYTYNIGGTAQTSSGFSHLVVGNYTATVTDKNGCIYQKPFTITQVNTAIADFSYAPTIICVNEPVVFTKINSTTNIQTWSFNLQDSITANPVHVFTDTGTYQITLIAWRNQRQCSDTITKTLVVKECPPDSINLTVPNIFSPNADGINDAWQVLVYNINYAINNYACTIYD
ncbi:MAG: PKD domain-containing protein, partial [Bacteroidia bacterium]